MTSPRSSSLLAPPGRGGTSSSPTLLSSPLHTTPVRVGHGFGVEGPRSGVLTPEVERDLGRPTSPTPFLRLSPVVHGGWTRSGGLCVGSGDRNGRSYSTHSRTQEHSPTPKGPVSPLGGPRLASLVQSDPVTHLPEGPFPLPPGTPHPPVKVPVPGGKRLRRGPLSKFLLRAPRTRTTTSPVAPDREPCSGAPRDRSGRRLTTGRGQRLLKRLRLLPPSSHGGRGMSWGRMESHGDGRLGRGPRARGTLGCGRRGGRATPVPRAAATLDRDDPTRCDDPRHPDPRLHRLRARRLPLLVAATELPEKKGARPAKGAPESGGRAGVPAALLHPGPDPDRGSRWEHSDSRHRLTLRCASDDARLSLLRRGRRGRGGGRGGRGCGCGSGSWLGDHLDLDLSKFFLGAVSECGWVQCRRTRHSAPVAACGSLPRDPVAPGGLGRPVPGPLTPRDVGPVSFGEERRRRSQRSGRVGAGESVGGGRRTPPPSQTQGNGE